MGFCQGALDEYCILRVNVCDRYWIVEVLGSFRFVLGYDFHLTARRDTILPEHLNMTPIYLEGQHFYYSILVGCRTTKTANLAWVIGRTDKPPITALILQLKFQEVVGEIEFEVILLPPVWIAVFCIL